MEEEVRDKNKIVNRRQFLQVAGIGIGYRIFLPFISATVDRTLKTAFAKHGIDFGYAVDIYSPVSRPIVERDASILVPETAMTMVYYRPERYMFDAEGINTLFTYGCKVHGGAICWHMMNPEWFYELPNNQVATVLEENIEFLSDFDFYSIDVVNEAKITGSWFGKWYEAMGSSYVNTAFDLVAQYMPNTLRVYNANFINQAEKDLALQLVRDGRAQAIGYEAHMSEGSFERIDVGFGQEIVSRGAQFYLSECDVMASSEEKFKQLYLDLVKDGINAGMSRFIVWGVKDPNWLGDCTLRRSGDGLEKEAYWDIVEWLN